MKPKPIRADLVDAVELMPDSWQRFERALRKAIKPKAKPGAIKRGRSAPHPRKRK